MKIKLRVFLFTFAFCISLFTNNTFVVEAAYVSPVSANIDPGFYLQNSIEKQKIELSSETDGAVIYYTIDGKTPTTKSIKYTTPFSITKSTTINAIAVKSKATSKIATLKYTVIPNINCKSYSNYGELSLADRISMTITGKSMKVSGKVFSDFEKRIKITISRNSNNDKVISQTCPVSADGTYLITLQLNDISAEDTYTLEASTYESEDDNEIHRFNNVNMECKDGDITFAYDKNYEFNYVRRAQLISERSIKDCLQKSSDPKIKTIAKEILSGLNKPEEKLRAIHDWVAENIYYDQDLYFQIFDCPSFGYGSTLDAKKGVCEDYTRIFCQLVREADIPCAPIYGPACGLNGWEDHAWNEAYIDGRWIIIDTTWDSSTSYSRGQYVRDPASYEYYDISLENISKDHKWWN